jgi:hypothetical protein
LRLYHPDALADHATVLAKIARECGEHIHRIELRLVREHDRSEGGKRNIQRTDPAHIEPERRAGEILLADPGEAVRG